MRFATLQGTGALLGEAEVLFGQALQGLVLGDLHARAHVAVAVHEEGESAGQVLAKTRKKKQEEEVWNVEVRDREFWLFVPPPSPAPRSKWEPPAGE